MSLDIGPLLELGAQLAAEAITTSGTTVDIARNPGGLSRATVNRATLAVTDPTPPTVLHAAAPAIIIPAQSTAGQPQGPNVEGQKDAYTVILLPGITDVAPTTDEVTVVSSLDARLVGRTLLVKRVADNTAGAVRVLFCEAP